MTFDHIDNGDGNEEHQHLLIRMPPDVEVAIPVIRRCRRFLDGRFRRGSVYIPESDAGTIRQHVNKKIAVVRRYEADCCKWAGKAGSTSDMELKLELWAFG